jgi:nitrite reductase (NADH) large subunit
MFYIRTADRMQRTSVWRDNMEGGLEYLKAVIIDDSLGIGEELEKQMQYLVIPSNANGRPPSTTRKR